MKRAPTVAAVLCLLLVGCAKRTFDGRWHLEKDKSNMPQGFNLPGEDFIEITSEPEGVRMREFVSSTETGAQTLADRHYPFSGEKLTEGEGGSSALYTSARQDDDKLCTTDRITHTDGQPEMKLTVCYEVSWNGMTLTGTDQDGKKITYERQ